MEQQLVRFIGSGLAVLAIERMDVPRGTIENGEALIQHLLRFGSGGIGALTITVAGDVWRGWNETGLPRALAESHIRALPAILDVHRPARWTLLEMLAGGPSAARGKFSAEAQLDPTALSTDILSRAELAGDIAKAGLSHQISFFLVERLFTALLPYRHALRAPAGAAQTITPSMPQTDLPRSLRASTAATLAATWEPSMIFSQT